MFKKSIFFSCLILSIFSLASCKSNKVQEPSVVLPVETPSDDEVVFLNENAEIVVDEEEFIRSTNNLSGEETVTKKEFSDDKAQILQIIEELSVIMEKQDYESWLDYIDPASIRYYSSPSNIIKAQKKLPNKTIELHGLNDYFKYVFIPSRKRSEVDEIRYISKNNIKAVKVKTDGSINVYYYFVKINGKWLVHIPTL